MLLDQAVKRFEAQFTANEALNASDGIADVVSGGIRRKGGPLPVLYADQECAVDDWLAAAEAAALDCGPQYRFIEKPSLRQYQMTISDVPATQRVTDSRWVVESRIVFAH